MSSDASSVDGDLSTATSTASRGRITIERYDADALRTALPQWPDLSTERKLAAVRLLAPIDTATTSNTACRGQHELLARYLSRSASPTATASHLAVGTDNGTAPTYEDTALNNEGYRTAVTDAATDGTTVVATTFLDSTEANDMDPSSSGNSIREIGLVTSDGSGEGQLLNHALVGPEPKSSTVALTITVRLSWEAVQ